MSDEEEDDDPFAFQKRLSEAKTLDFSETKTFERSEDLYSEKTIEPDEKAKIIELDKVTKTFRVQGYDLPEPKKPRPGAEKRALKKDDRTSEFKRNRKDYRVICPTCLGTGKCQNCNGKGKVKIFFKCKVCMGTGKCQDCDKDIEVDCPYCGNPISMYTDVCMKCGKFFSCPECQAPLPAMGTRCMVCKTEFNCKNCDKPYPVAYSWKCPHCGFWNE